MTGRDNRLTDAEHLQLEIDERSGANAACYTVVAFTFACLIAAIILYARGVV